MKPFFSRELSQALQEAGCVPSNGWYYSKRNGVLCYFAPYSNGEEVDGFAVAFGWWDLCGGSERTRENARKWWGDENIKEEAICNCRHCNGHDGTEAEAFETRSAKTYHRHALIDLPEDEQERYVMKTFKGNNNAR